MDYIFGEWRFTLLAGGAVDVYRGHKGPVTFYPGNVVTYNDLSIWAWGFMSGKAEGWGETLD